MELFLTILLFVVVILIAAVLFAGWIVMMVLRAGWNALRGVGWMMTGGSKCAMFGCHKKKRVVTCLNEQCQATNPPAARFCRRCGQPMKKTVQVFARAAMY